MSNSTGQGPKRKEERTAVIPGAIRVVKFNPKDYLLSEWGNLPHGVMQFITERVERIIMAGKTPSSAAIADVLQRDVDQVWIDFNRKDDRQSTITIFVMVHWEKYRITTTPQSLADSIRINKHQGSSAGVLAIPAFA